MLLSLYEAEVLTTCRICYVLCSILNLGFSRTQLSDSVSSRDVIVVATPGIREVYAKTYAAIYRRLTTSRVNDAEEKASTMLMMVNPRNDEL